MAETPLDISDLTPKAVSQPKPRRKRQAILEDTIRPPGEEWMLTYMDTVTLLVTLFVMILSFASFDTEKYKIFSHGMSLAKYGSGIMMGTLSIRDNLTEKKQAIPLSPSISESQKTESESESERVEMHDKVLAALQDQINQQGLDNDIVIREREGTVEMEINESVLFPAGSADLSEMGLSVLVRLSNLLKTHSGTISVEGHTDNLPIETDLFPSNWELSGGRASSVVRRLISSGVDPLRLRIIGYADIRPLADNTSPDGRQRNRRVNIVLEFPAQSPSN